MDEAIRARNWSAEFALAVDCCRWNFRSPHKPPPITVADGLDWTKFLRLVRFHRVEGLVSNALKGSPVPDEVRSALAEAASAIAANHLRASSACDRLLRAFEREGLPLIFLKGVTLARLAYRDPSLKAAIDMDLLIDPADLADAAGLLRQCGYRLVAPRDRGDERLLRNWHQTWKESVWANGFQLDLHTRTADNRRLIPGISARSPVQIVDVGGGVCLPTLADEELFAYLAVHGASSAWFRLKWIADVAGFLNRRTASAVEHLYYRSQNLGAGRAAGQALLLADELFGTLQKNRALHAALRSEGGTRWLVESTLRQLEGDPVEPTERRWGTLAIHKAQFALLPDLAYKASELTRQAKVALWRFR